MWQMDYLSEMHMIVIHTCMYQLGVVHVFSVIILLGDFQWELDAHTVSVKAAS